MLLFSNLCSAPMRRVSPATRINIAGQASASLPALWSGSDPMRTASVSLARWPGASSRKSARSILKWPFHASPPFGLASGKSARVSAAVHLLRSMTSMHHLAALDAISKANPELAAALGSDYLIKPDVVVIRFPEEDSAINADGLLVDKTQANLTPLRRVNSERPILHASVSCKWTLRSDRAQNARSEGLNLVRNRKGRLPHIVVVTGEPTPNRIASIALGTGDIDCVYHFALPELLETIQNLGFEDAEEMLHTMIDGKRLRDIADLPLDLAI